MRSVELPFPRSDTKDDVLPYFESQVNRPDDFPPRTEYTNGTIPRVHRRYRHVRVLEDARHFRGLDSPVLCGVLKNEE